MDNKKQSLKTIFSDALEYYKKRDYKTAEVYCYKILNINSNHFDSLSLLANIFAQYLQQEYPYDVVGGNRLIKQADFDERIDIVPVADPNIFSMTQRISLAQTE